MRALTRGKQPAVTYHGNSFGASLGGHAKRECGGIAMNILSTLLLWSWLIAYWQDGQRRKAIVMNFLSTLLFGSWLIACWQDGQRRKEVIRSRSGAEQ
jgi:hypothetical protein